MQQNLTGILEGFGLFRLKEVMELEEGTYKNSF